MDRILQILKAEEAVVPYPYKDHLGFWTIGIGHLIDRRRGGSLPSWVQPSFPLNDDEIIELCKADIKARAVELSRRVAAYDALDLTRQRALICMAFQLGVNGVANFRNAMLALQGGDWARAGVELRDSTWWRTQTRARAERIARVIETGDDVEFKV